MILGARQKVGSTSAQVVRSTTWCSTNSEVVQRSDSGRCEAAEASPAHPTFVEAILKENCHTRRMWSKTEVGPTRTGVTQRICCFQNLQILMPRGLMLPHWATQGLCQRSYCSPQRIAQGRSGWPEPLREVSPLIHATAGQYA
jgi:hypothetical protein